MEKLHYDYAVGLSTPYWIQEVRLKGNCIGRIKHLFHCHLLVLD